MKIYIWTFSVSKTTDDKLDHAERIKKRMDHGVGTR